MGRKKKKRAVKFAQAERFAKFDMPETDETEAFWVKFLVPTMRKRRRYALTAGIGKNIQEGEKAPKDQAAVEEYCYNVVSDCVKEWSLDHPCTPEAINGMEDLEVILTISNAIIAEADKRKN